MEQEFHKFLQCGALGSGFARFRCAGCGFDRLVPFSCKSHALCPSCGGRRMTERAAHLVDHVFTRVAVRQCVLSLPYRLRYRLAWDHALCRAVVGCAMRAILGFLRRRARDAGVRDGRGGAVTIVQRFAGALNLNIHFHALVLDGVFSKDGDAVRFHPSPSLDAADVDEILARSKPTCGRSWRDMAPPGRTRLRRSTREGSRLRYGRGWPRRPCKDESRWGRGTAPARGPVWATDGTRQTGDSAPADDEPATPGYPRAGGNYLWADLMRLSLGLDVLVCPHCGGRLRLISVTDNPAIVARILRHLRLPTEMPGTRPARAPPTEVADLFVAADPA